MAEVRSLEPRHDLAIAAEAADWVHLTTVVHSCLFRTGTVAHECVPFTGAYAGSKEAPMWWLWIVLAIALVLLLGIALFRSRRGWGPRSGPYRDDQAVARTMFWITKNRDARQGGR